MNNFFSRKFKYIFIIFVLIFAFVFQTVAYSAINSTMVLTGDAYTRVNADVRVTDFGISEVSSDAVSYYEEFGKDHLMTNISLPSSSSYIIYKVEVTNYGSRSAGVYSISLNNSNLKYELIDYTVGNKIYDSTNKKYTLGAKQTFYLKILYNSYDSSNTSFDLKVSFDFQPFYSISYVDFSNNYITEIMAKKTLSIDFTSETPSKLEIYMGNTLTTNYTYSNYKLTMTNITGDILITNKMPYEESILKTSVPILSDYMIPVMWDYGQNAWIVADIYEVWYSYEGSAWANAIVLKEPVDYEPGTIIDLTDGNILQWYVWIPQFCMITDNITFTGENSAVPDPNSINIWFGLEHEEYVHSAFKNVDYDEFTTGFWIGKFATYFDESNSIYQIKQNVLPTFCTPVDCNEMAYNVYYDDVFFSRLIRNSEWAAVAYLSASLYGKSGFNQNYFGITSFSMNEEVWVNTNCGSINPVTGACPTDKGHYYGGGNNIKFFSEEDWIAGGTTTGNIYGVYDMVSCVGTIVAGQMYVSDASSNLSSDLSRVDLYIGIDSYWDGISCLEFSSSTYYECNDHAMYDTEGWFNDYYFSNIPYEFGYYSNTPFLIRGTYTSNSDYYNGQGIFSVYGISEDTTGGFRTVLEYTS